jgi:hypothetical protein
VLYGRWSAAALLSVVFLISTAFLIAVVRRLWVADRVP